MIYANKTSKFAKKILSNCLILQFLATQTILFCIFCNYKLHKNEAPEVFAPAGREVIVPLWLRTYFRRLGVPVNRGNRNTGRGI